MFTTVESVEATTGYVVSTALVRQAQAIIEAFVGRLEVDVTNPSDAAILGRATEYQAAYMSKNYESVFEQIAVSGISQTDGSIVLDTSMLAPFLAPLAVIATRSLSWNASRSIKTGRAWGDTFVLTPWERD